MFSSKMSGNSTRAVVDKILHDASFDMAYSYVKSHVLGIDNQDYDEDGNNLESVRVFDYVDLDYLEILFAKDGIIEFLKKTVKSK